MFDKFQDRGRTLKIEFECGRCHCTHIEDLETVCKRSGDHNERITWLNLPKGWSDRQGWLPLLCDKCNDDLNSFLKGKVIRE